MSFAAFLGEYCNTTGDGSVYNSTRSKRPTKLTFKPPKPPLSLNIKAEMEGFSDFGFSEKSREEEYESSENMEDPSGGYDQNNQDERSSKRKKYHRHTSFQIQELENAFKENPHPDEKARLALSRKLNLETKQVKFWFQNRRTQMKTLMERHENSLLRQENDNLRVENIAIKEAMRNPVCCNCGGSATLGELSMEEHQLRIENARLKDELNRLSTLANKFGKPHASLPNPMSPSIAYDLELAVGRGLSTSLPMGITVTSGFPQLASSSTRAVSNVGAGAVYELAMNAMHELVNLSQTDIPLWCQSSNGYGDVLNVDEYIRTFPSCLGLKPHGFVTEATRASVTVMINSLELIQILMDSNSWNAMFPTLIGESSTIDVLSSGVGGGSKDGALQMMQAEFLVLSPLVPARKVKFLRYCKKHSEGFWGVVDVSVVGSNGEDGGAFSSCRRLPSGCIVQEMPNGFSKVIWIEHVEYADRNVHPYFKALLESGMGFGAQKWVATLERQCGCLAVLMQSDSGPADELSAIISASGKKSLAKLSKRMTRTFCNGVCGTYHNWEIVQMGTTKDLKLLMRRDVGGPGEPSGCVLSAAITVLLPVSHRRVFDFLANEQTRCLWDILSHDGLMNKMLHIATGQDPGNNICLIRSSGANGNGMMIMQETSTDVSGSTVIYTAVEVPAMSLVIKGGDSSWVPILPSGFAIFPYVLPPDASGGPGTSSGSVNGCLLTIGFQIMVNCLPSSKLSTESIQTVTRLISHTIDAIKGNLACD